MSQRIFPFRMLRVTPVKPRVTKWRNKFFSQKTPFKATLQPIIYIIYIYIGVLREYVAKKFFYKRFFRTSVVCVTRNKSASIGWKRTFFVTLLRQTPKIAT